MLVKRISAGTWMGGHVIDNGSTTNYAYLYEFNTSDQLAADLTGTGPFNTTATFNSTTSWEILGFTWDGTATAGHWVWRWKVGAGAWSSETGTTPGGTGAAGSGYRHLIGNEAALGDDANFDVACVGLIKSNLSQASFESLDMLAFSTWQSVFTGAGAWLMGFDTIATQTDRTGNGGNELSRSAGITLVADPAGWAWSAAVGGYLPVRKFPGPIGRHGR